MADRAPSTPPPEIPEYRALPSEREGRRVSRRRRTIVLSVLVHIVMVLLFVVVLPHVLAPWRQSVDVVPAEPESMPVRFTDQRVRVPEPVPPDTNVIAEADAVARSPGEGPPTPHGPTDLPDPTLGRKPAPQPALEPLPPPDPRPPEDPNPAPDTSAPAPSVQEDSALDKRRRVADALGQIGGRGQAGDAGWGDLAGQASSGLSFAFGGGAMQIESRSDLDWGPWARLVQQRVKENWYSVMPVAARVGMQGVVVVRFRVQRDGRITDYEQLESAGVPPLDRAVDDALVVMSSPLPPLPIPADSDEESIRITYTFIYNLDGEREVRAWRRMNWQRQRSAGGG